MNNGENELVGTKLRNAVRKLISEEYYAYKFYLLSEMAVCNEQRKFIFELFGEIANDELNDHLKMLIEWCACYGLDVPCGDSDFKKYAATKISRQIQQIKKNKTADYYIAEAIKAEEAAIESYKTVLQMKEICEFTDLQSALWKIYYDEEEHLQKLNTAAIAFSANADLIM